MSTRSSRYTPPQWQTAALVALVTVAVYAAGWAVHAAAAPEWLTGAMAAAAAAAVLTPVLAHCGPGLTAAYTLACCVAASCWLTYAAATPPGRLPAVLTLAAAGGVLGSLYPSTRRHQRRLADEARRLAAEEQRRAAERKWPDLLGRLGYAGITLRSQMATRSGETVVLGLPPDGRVRYTTLAGAAERIEIAARLRHGAVRVERGVRADEVLLHVAARDVLAETIPMPAAMRPLTVNQPLPVGLREDGTVCTVTLREVAALIVGLRGSGKSNLINVLIAQLARCPDALIFMIDLKGGRTALPWLRPWLDGRARRPVIDWLATTREEAERMLHAVLRGIDARAHSGAGGEKIIPSPAMPAVILIIEEVAVIFGMTSGPRTSLEGTTNATLAALGTQVTQLGRSEAIDPVLVTQRGAVTMLGSADLKSQCALRFGLGVATEADARLVVPDDMHVAADLARLVHPGSGIVQSRDGRPMPVKFYRLTYDRIAAIAERAGDDRPAPEPVLADAFGQDYRQRWSQERAGHLRLPHTREVPATAQRSPSQPGALAADTDREFAEIVAGLGEGRGHGDHPGGDGHAGGRVSDGHGGDGHGGGGSGDGSMAPVRARMLQLLDGTGVRGATTAHLQSMLEAEGFGAARQSLDRWLAEEESAGRVQRASYGRWKTR